MIIRSYPSKTILDNGASVNIFINFPRNKLFRHHSPNNCISWKPPERKKKSKEESVLYKFSSKYKWEYVEKIKKNATDTQGSNIND